MKMASIIRKWKSKNNVKVSQHQCQINNESVMLTQCLRRNNSVIMWYYAEMIIMKMKMSIMKWRNGENEE